jgi:hypothetical protein
MSERAESYFKQFEGMEVEKSIYRIKGKSLCAYAKAIGDPNPKYYIESEGVDSPDYSKIEAHPAYAATYTIPGLFKLADANGTDGQPMIKNVGKLLHTGQDYDFSGCVPLKPTETEKVYTYAKVDTISIKSEILWISVKMETKNKEGDKLFCKTTLTVGIRKGGY